MALSLAKPSLRRTTCLGKISTNGSKQKKKAPGDAVLPDALHAQSERFSGIFRSASRRNLVSFAPIA